MDQAVLNVRFDEDDDLLKWDEPKKHDQDIPVYNVYFKNLGEGTDKNDTNESDDSEVGFKNDREEPAAMEGRLDEPEVSLRFLEPCRRYLVGVSLLNENWECTPPTNWLRFRSMPDSKSAPANFEADLIGRTIRFTWKPECEDVDAQKPKFKFTIKNLKLNKDETREVKGYTFVYRAEKATEYLFEVAGTADGAEPASKSVVVP